MSRLSFSFLAITSACAALGLAACQSEADSDPRLADRLVQIATVQSAGDDEMTFTGLVVARVQSDLGFRVQGKIIERMVDTGQVVKAGQPLMRIDPNDLTLAITAQAQSVAAAKAREIQASADEKRYRALLGTRAISQQSYELAKAAADSARALLAAAEAQERVSRNQGDYSLLLADANGTIVETLAEPGQVVAQGQAVMRLAHAGPREAAIDLPEIIRPKLGSLAHVRLFGDDESVPARLRQLSDAADIRTRTFEARYVLEGDGANAPLGTTVKLTLSKSPPGNLVQLPIGAINDEGKGSGVWVVDEQTSTIVRREVQVDKIANETAVLHGDLHAGEHVVAMGGHFLHAGDHIRTAGTRAAMQ